MTYCGFSLLSAKGLIRYLTKYLASPPICVSRIIGYENGRVKYYYKSHRTKAVEYECFDVERLSGRMVQHILPKGFQRVRYCGLQTTACFNRWYKLM